MLMFLDATEIIQMWRQCP